MAVKKKNQNRRKGGSSEEGGGPAGKKNSTGEKGAAKQLPPIGLCIIISSSIVCILSCCLYFGYGPVADFDKSSNKYDVAQQEKSCAADGTCFTPPADTSTCGFWIAKSTLPNAGLGMFAGRDFAPYQELGVDRVIPIIDLAKHQGYGWPFLWNSYTWSADRIANEADEVSLALNGVGSTANAHTELRNIVLEHTYADSTTTTGLHRSKDPGVGASTPYSKVMRAKWGLQTGQEMFVSYGDSWFIQRTDFIGFIPLEGDVDRADSLFKNWRRLANKHGLREEAFRDYWETFVSNSLLRETSRILSALPNNWTDLDQVAESNLKKYMEKKSTRSIEWLEENGICGDNFRPGPSGILQAGDGAFATRALTQGAIVAPLPLIHVPFRQKFQMQNQHQFQLLLNYCFGHRQSTLLLCPYGSMTSYINHNHQHPNVKIQWPSELSRSRGHEPDWLDISVNDLWTEKQHAGLAFEMVALRSIEEGEEILLDYGTEWEVAWQKHVQTYNAPQTDYTSLTTLNDAETLKTQEEQSRNPYPSNAQIMMELAFVQSIEWQSARWSRSRATLLEWKRQIRGWQLIECEIMDRKDGDRNGYYKVGFSFEQKYHVAEGLPREAFEFKDKPYTSDIHLHNAFRHDMRVPDEIFPEAWKNIR
jgi:hypothetical protein